MPNLQQTICFKYLNEFKAGCVKLSLPPSYSASLLDACTLAQVLQVRKYAESFSLLCGDDVTDYVADAACLQLGFWRAVQPLRFITVPRKFAAFKPYRLMSNLSEIRKFRLLLASYDEPACFKIPKCVNSFSFVFFANICLYVSCHNIFSWNSKY